LLQYPRPPIYTLFPYTTLFRSYILTTFNVLSHAKDLPELFMKFGEEVKLWRMLRRFTTQVKTELDDRFVDHARKIQAYQIGYYLDRKSTRLNSSHVKISYAVFC